MRGWGGGITQATPGFERQYVYTIICTTVCTVYVQSATAQGATYHDKVGLNLVVLRMQKVNREGQRVMF